MNFNKHILFDHLLSVGLSESSARYANMISLAVIVLILILIVDYIVRKILLQAFSQFAQKSKTQFDDFLVQNKVTRNIAHIVPLLITIEFVPIVFADFQYFENMAEKGLAIFSIVLTLWIVRSILNTIKDFLKTIPNLKDKPISSYIQVFMIFAWLIGIMSAFAIITNTSIWKFFTALGAASAVIILVFKDTIMGFVASIQVSVNDMVRIGDWITFEKYGADGDVIEITLATVKVQNFDKTITTIPTYALISDSFKNWRGMVSSDGRRIKRSLSILQNSVKFLSHQEIERLKQIDLISHYLNTKQKDISNHNAQINANKELLINGRNLTNLGVFRKYIDQYLNQHSAVNKDMMIMVRQLAPTAEGIPLEVYAFSSDKRWENYEYIMADIFDHLIAATSYFDLKIFELPNNSNFSTPSLG